MGATKQLVMSLLDDLSRLEKLNQVMVDIYIKDTQKTIQIIKENQNLYY